ncbi:MAG: CCA tRNA nucleotidyltransferase [Candidatus Thorarchaeota archaeon]|jgi:tRNA nucleotidyltransferase/poly(A) polymerase
MKATPEYIISKLCKLGYETYVVGGAVRDFLQCKTPTDEDIVTKATPKEVSRIFRKHRIAYGGTYFRVTFVDGIEVATFRKDIYKGLNDKNVTVVPAETILEDLNRRDLTINAIAWCQFTGRLIDPHHGVDDLYRKKIRFVGDPIKRIFEDPNRIIRACRFLAVIDGEFGNKDLEALKQSSFMVDKHVAKERIREEVLKSMKARNASTFFHALHRIDALKYIFPMLDCCYQLEDFHGLHHRESIITHSYVAGDSISTKYPLLKLATYLHDIGKFRACHWNPKTSDLKFTSHDKIGAEIISEELWNLKFSKKEIEYITALIRLHMNNFLTPKAIRKTVRKLNEHNIPYKDLYRLKLADSNANIWKGTLPLSRIKEELALIEKSLNIKSSNRFDQLAINGKNIMEISGLKPGPEIGKIKNILLECVLDEPELNNEVSLKTIVEEYMEYRRELND